MRRVTVQLHGEPLCVGLTEEELARLREPDRRSQFVKPRPAEPPVRLDLGCMVFFGTVCLLLGFILRDWFQP